MKKRLFLISLIVLFLDILSKYLVFGIVKYENSKVIISNFFTILPTKNYGAAFSIFENANMFLIVVSTLILMYLFILIKKQSLNKLSIFSYGLLIGGLIGNLYDRIIYSYVRDFFSFTIFGKDFAIFNVADIAIVIGAILLMFNIFKEGSKNETNK